MTKQLSPLRRKDIETGRKLERTAIVVWLRDVLEPQDEDFSGWLASTLANWIKAEEHLK